MRVRILLVAALAVIAGYRYWPSPSSSVSAPVGGKRSEDLLAIAPEVLDLGTVGAVSDFEFALPIRNTSEFEVEIAKVQSSCGCTKIAPESLTIAAGETEVVDLQLDLLYLAKGKHGPFRDFDVDIAALTSSPEQGRADWRLKGTIHLPLSFEPREIDITESDGLIHGTPHEATTVKFRSIPPLSSIDVSVRPPLFDAAASLTSDTTGEIALSPRPDLEPGRYECVVEASGFPSSGDSLVPVAFKAAVRVLHDLRATPERLSFRPAKVGSDLELTVTIESRTETPFTLALLDSDEVQIEATAPEYNAANTAASLTVRLRVAETGPRTSVIRYAVDQTGERRSPDFEIPVAYFGLKEK